jgi:hypothetical protein
MIQIGEGDGLYREPYRASKHVHHPTMKDNTNDTDRRGDILYSETYRAPKHVHHPTMTDKINNTDMRG